MAVECAALVTLAVQLIGFVEIIYTVFNFDEEKYGIINIALVFYLQPIITYVAKLCAGNCLEGCLESGGCQNSLHCFNTTFDLAAEIVQFIFFIHYCSMEQHAIVILGICTVLQSILILCAPCFEDPAEKFEMNEEIGQGAIGCVCGAVFEGVGLALLFIPGDTPFKEKTYEVPFAFMCWLTSVFACMITKEKSFGKFYDISLTSFIATTACMIPYTVLLAAHWYAEWKFSINIIVGICASCCCCCTMCLSLGTVDKEKMRGEEDEEDSEYDEEEE